MITLYTLCPDCKREHAITVKQLRISRAIVQCNRCSVKFDALELLNDTPKQHPDKPKFAMPDSAFLLNDNADQQLAHRIADSELPLLPWELMKRTRLNIHWNLSCCLLGLLLIFQIYWFQSNNLVQSITTRPWLVSICEQINCVLPTYNNIAKIKILHGDLRATKNHQLMVQVVFSNDGQFKQVYPGLKLTLLRYNGDVLAQRVFSVKEYLPGKLQHHVASGEQVDVKFIIAEPPEKVGGYKFELT